MGLERMNENWRHTWNVYSFWSYSSLNLDLCVVQVFMLLWSLNNLFALCSRLNHCILTFYFLLWRKILDCWIFLAWFLSNLIGIYVKFWSLGFNRGSSDQFKRFTRLDRFRSFRIKFLNKKKIYTISFTNGWFVCYSHLGNLHKSHCNLAICMVEPPYFYLVNKSDSSFIIFLCRLLWLVVVTIIFFLPKFSRFSETFYT